MTIRKEKTAAVWALTPEGADLARRLAGKLARADLYLPGSITDRNGASRPFLRLGPAVSEAFHRYSGHVFIMSCGIVVRTIAPLIRKKTTDPAVVVMDEAGRFAVSLLSGHVGGANLLAEAVSGVCGAVPVVTTTSDIRGTPAVDSLAAEKGLFIENPEAVRDVQKELLSGRPIFLHDPFDLIRPDLPETFLQESDTPEPVSPGVWVDDRITPVSPGTLLLRPPTLAAGIGCNRNTPREEIGSFLLDVLARFGLSAASLFTLATADLKRDEPGLNALAADLDLPVSFFSRESLKSVENLVTPSTMVEKHIGVQSVCEAAAILASEKGELIVPKQISPNVTVAVARIPCTSSASGRATRPTSPEGRAASSNPWTRSSATRPISI